MNTGQEIKMEKPYWLSIGGILRLLEKHFSYQYDDTGAARLPVLAIYAVYQCTTMSRS